MLADVIIAWLKLYNSIYNKNLKKTNITNWDFWKKLNLNRKEFEKIFTETWIQWKKIPPTEKNLDKKVSILETLGVIDIVTGRSQITIPYVKAWLNNQGIKYKNFIQVPKYSLKSNLNYDLFIDDSPHNVLSIAKNSKYSILYDQPWNHNIINNSTIFRVKNLNEAIEVIHCLKIEGLV